MIKTKDFEESLILTLEDNSPDYPKEQLPLLLEVVNKLADLDCDAIGLMWIEDLKLFIVEMYFRYDLFLQVQVFPDQTIDDKFASTIFLEKDILRCSEDQIDEIIKWVNLFLAKLD